MSDSREEKKPKSLKVNELILSGKSLAKHIEEMKRERFLRERVVNLSEYRKLRATPKQNTVLVVDEDESSRSCLVSALEKEGYKTLSASNEEELAKVIECQPFDLLVLDPSLRGVNALELCYLMKGNRVLRKIPVVFISADAGKDNVRKAFEVGCDDYISKPFKTDHVLRIVKYFLESA